MQITEGSDGNVYIQSVILGGPAHLSGNVLSGDQVVAVDGRSLLGVKYDDALELLKSRGEKVEFILSRVVSSRNKNPSHFGMKKANLSNINETHITNTKFDLTVDRTHRAIAGSNSHLYPQTPYRNYRRESPVEKHLTESCYDISNLHKYGLSAKLYTEVPYHKHIRYEIEAERDNLILKNSRSTKNSQLAGALNKNISKSCSHLCSEDKAVVVKMIPKCNVDVSAFRSLDRQYLKRKGLQEQQNETSTTSPIALPRSLGLSRKWRGPVRYPVTPIKKVVDTHDTDSCAYVSTSDEEQVFI
ncbi:hypothetical protein NQ317_008744 [Molorchus minor]|uniref:PDZ domain-containing protein n=1 Tax=Molorchus minor TaxID=1323400 RepID=A0ABQ9JAY3_9CUCU|nr:hypothetical protein NQ317_008744 [Molorchus minor]